MPRSTSLPPPSGPNRAGLRGLCAAGLCLAAVSAACSKGPADPTGVLWISIDSLRADHLSCYGYRSATRPNLETTPAIDRLLAREGILFEQAFSTTSWTLPSHVAMLSGLPNQTHRVLDLPDRIPRDLHWLPEAFELAGFSTFGVWSGPNLHPFFGFARGFEQYEDRSSSDRLGDGSVFRATDTEGWEALQEVHDESHETVTGERVAQAFEEYALGLGDEPFFAFAHLWDVHYDYHPPEHFDVFYPNYQGSVTGEGFTKLSRGARLSGTDLARWISLYDAEIRFTDENVGRMLAALDAADRTADTLIVLTSDHGEEFAEHGAFGHKATLFDEVLHVPLILRCDGRVPAGQRETALVSLIDLAPTVASLLGVEYDAPGGGLDLSRLWSKQPSDLSERNLPIEMTLRPFGIHLGGTRGQKSKVVIGRYSEKSKEITVLHDLVRDPGEHEQLVEGRDLQRDDPRVLRARDDLSRWLAHGDRYTHSSESAMPGELRQALEETGYLERKQ